MRWIWLLLVISQVCEGRQALQIPDWLNSEERNQVQIFRTISPNVVHVSNIRYQRLGFSLNVHEVPAGAGTGFVWDDKGHIVTNFHVIQGHSRLFVSLKGGQDVEAEIVGVEPRKDIAVLKVKLPKNLATQPIAVADSSQLLVGQKTIAIGSPFGLDQTMTTGIVSALGRSIPGVGKVTIRDMIQTDAAINPGNSGGPLLDSRGYLIGMNTAIYSQSGSSAGVGFAVPSNTIKRMVNQIIKYGRTKQPGIGITVIPDHIAERYGIEGVAIMEVQPKGPAEKAGLKPSFRNRYGEVVLGDRIVGVNGVKIKSFDDLYNELSQFDVGTEVTISIQRKDKALEKKVRLVDVQSER